MIRAMHKMLTTPIKKKMADGGDLDWNNAISGNKYAVAPPIVDTSMGYKPGPIGANTPTTTQPLQIDPQTNTGSSSFLSSLTKLGSGINKAGTSIAPFASNIVNQFQTPPQPSQPHLDNMVTLRAPSYANERVEAQRNINADVEGSARAVDGNTGARIRMFGLGQKLQQLGSINEREKNAQIGVQNEQARINAGIMGRNNEKLDQYGNQKVEREIALQRTRSENLSNMSDKIVNINNENAKRQLDLDKTKTMSTLFSRSGVGSRERAILKNLGVPDPLGQNYSDISDTEKKANGGMMSGVRTDHSRGFYKNLAVRGQTLKSLYRAPN